MRPNGAQLMGEFSVNEMSRFMDEMSGSQYLSVPGLCQHWVLCSRLVSIPQEAFPLEGVCKHSPSCYQGLLSNEKPAMFIVMNQLIKILLI